MAQVSPQWQQRIHSLQTIQPTFNRQLSKLIKRIQSSRTRSISLITLALLLLWNWKFVVAGSAGALAVVVTYFAQQGQWRFFWFSWDKLWTSTNRSLTLSIASGSITMLSTYVAIAVWTGSDNHWLAAAVILQEFSILLVLALLIGQALQQQTPAQREDKLPLMTLADPDPLKRLIAVRQITDRFSQMPMAKQEMMRSHIAECFRLMLNRETEPAICNALLDGLQVVSPSKQLGRGREPLTIAATAQRRPIARARRSVAIDKSLQREMS